MIKIKIGDKIYISANIGSYKGMYFRETGTVIDIHTKNVTVRLDNKYNAASEKGLFYFKPSEVVVAASFVHEKDNDDDIEEEYWKSESADFIKYGIELGRVNELNKNQNIFEQEYETEWIGDKKMRTEKILNLWKNNQEEILLNEHKKTVDEVFLLDDLYKSIKTKLDDVNEILKINGYRDSYKVSTSYTKNSTDGKLEDLETDMGNKRRLLHNFITEVRTMLEPCERYEQELDILKQYGIVDKNGVLVKDKKSFE